MDVHRNTKSPTDWLLTALLLLVGPLAMAGDDIDFQVIHPRIGPLPAGPSYLAIRSAEQWVAFSNSSSKALSLPPVDFSQYTLLIASPGAKGSSGYSILFSSISERTITTDTGGTITVSLLNMRAVGCPELTEITHPIAFALIPRTLKPIKFLVFEVNQDCSNHPTIVDDPANR
jgi:hypothetical protein